MKSSGDRCPKCDRPERQAKSTSWGSTYKDMTVEITIGKHCECGARYDHVYRVPGINLPPVVK